VCLLRWDVERDVFEEGDWFKGRIYERRSDLSPDGRYLVHLAGGFDARQPAGIETTYARTAVSELPGLRPLIWWEKDHSYHGGGLFRTDDELWVNDPTSAPARNELKTMRLLFNEDARGEDEPIYAERLSRDGWQVIDPLPTDDSGRRYEVRRRVGATGAALVMRRSLDGSRRVIGYRLEADGGASHPFEAEWADFDHRNRLVAARQGQIVELRPTDDGLHPTPLADLNDLVPPDREPERESSVS
jgi:hypothetical protein